MIDNSSDNDDDGSGRSHRFWFAGYRSYPCSDGHWWIVLNSEVYKAI